MSGAARFVVPVAAVLASLLLGARATTPADLPPVVQRPAGQGERVWFAPSHAHMLPLPGAAPRPVRSLLAITRPMTFGDYVWNEAGVPAGRAWVRIDLGRQTVSVFRGPDEIGSAVVIYGTDGKPTPTGLFPILAMAAQHRSSLYDAEMPYTLRLTGDGVAIHASHVRRGSATHGCIGVPLGFARRLFGAVRRGDLVAILPARAPPAKDMTTA